MKTLESTHILAQIVEAKRKRLADIRLRAPEPAVRMMAAKAAPGPSFRKALEAPVKSRIIAEIKKASPSRGVINKDLDVENLARAYADAGVVAISVVTEEEFFQGSITWIRRAARASGLPVLRKDFIFDSYQIHETRATGASAALLIVAMLTPEELKNLIDVTKLANLDALVEVHDEVELEEALAAGASIIGVNNRDLKTFEVDLETSLRLAPLIPDDVFFVAESGIRGKEDLARLSEAGADAVLVGEHLVASDDPAAAVRALL